MVLLPVRTSRAKPLPPEDRRAALIAATLPLLVRHGATVRTKAIAAACGVAEGTIFRVFRSKDELIRAAATTALDPTPMLDELAAVDIDLPLRQRLVVIVGILQRRIITVVTLMTALGWHHPPQEIERCTPPGPPLNEQVYRAVARLLEPDRAQLRRPPVEVARLLRLLTFSGSHLMIADGDLLTPEEIVDVVLDGLALRPPAPSGTPGARAAEGA